MNTIYVVCRQTDAMRAALHNTGSASRLGLGSASGRGDQIKSVQLAAPRVPCSMQARKHARTTTFVQHKHANSRAGAQPNPDVTVCRTRHELPRQELSKVWRPPSVIQNWACARRARQSPSITSSATPDDVGGVLESREARGHHILWNHFPPSRVVCPDGEAVCPNCSCLQQRSIAYCRHERTFALEVNAREARRKK